MKTAVSIPDKVFQAAEQEAHRRRISRSQLYTQALEGLLETKKKAEDEITAQINALIDEGVDTSMDPVWKAAQARALRKHGGPW